jgi:3'(2'), 5'-bisphosphate nucleotidase
MRSRDSVASDRNPGDSLQAVLTERLPDLTHIVSQAAATILAVDPFAIGTHQKIDLSPVTVADEAAERVILRGLAELAPGVPVVSEEADAEGRSPPPGTSFILVDPLDGTSEFVAGRGEYTVNVAVIADGAPVIGLVAAPSLGLIWRGVAGRGAERLQLAPGAGPGEAREVVAIRTRPAPRTGLVAAVSRSHFDPRSAALLAELPVAAHIVSGSSVKFCRIAEGAADIYPRLAPTREWDIAAGHAVLVAAGGAVTDPDGRPLSYGRADLDFRVPGFIAWSSADLAIASLKRSAAAT